MLFKLTWAMQNSGSISNRSFLQNEPSERQPFGAGVRLSRWPVVEYIVFGEDSGALLRHRPGVAIFRECLESPVRRFEDAKREKAAVRQFKEFQKLLVLRLALSLRDSPWELLAALAWFRRGDDRRALGNSRAKECESVSFGDGAAAATVAAGAGGYNDGGARDGTTSDDDDDDCDGARVRGAWTPWDAISERSLLGLELRQAAQRHWQLRLPEHRRLTETQILAATAGDDKIEDTIKLCSAQETKRHAICPKLMDELRAGSADGETPPPPKKNTAALQARVLQDKMPRATDRARATPWLWIRLQEFRQRFALSALARRCGLHESRRAAEYAVARMASLLPWAAPPLVPSIQHAACFAGGGSFSEESSAGNTCSMHWTPHPLSNGPEFYNTTENIGSFFAWQGNSWPVPQQLPLF